MQTLVLDGLSVTSEICHEIINDASYNVRILSIREVKNLNHAKLRGALQYACRPTRPKESPRLKALYVFGPKDGHTDHTNDSISVSWNRRSRDALASSTQLKGDPWWSERGQIVSRPISRDWVSCMASSEGIIAFDTVLCRGPRHQNSPVFGQPLILGDTAAAAATHAVAGCEGCGKAPEGLTRAGTCAAVTLPALAPVPVMSSSIHAATHPADSSQTFVPRCGDCLRERYCACCNKWWCESCYQLPGQGQDHGIHGVIVVDEDDSVSSMAQMLHSSETTPKIKVRRYTTPYNSWYSWQERPTWQFSGYFLGWRSAIWPNELPAYRYLQPPLLGCNYPSEL